MAKMFKDRRDEKEVQNDILQEVFINTTAGWINLLLLSSSGPIKIPVGACATALQSLEIASDTILSGKAKIMIAGGFDDLSEEGAYEFANMKATSNSDTEFAMGREPAEMSRPTTTTRAGFMEAQGAGVHIVMSAKTALELGAPVQGILAFTSTSSDKAGRSIPAPGGGPLTVAREAPSKGPLLRLDLNYRARQMAFRRKQIGEWLSHEQAQIQDEIEFRKVQGEPVDEEYFASRISDLELEARQQEKDALATYGMLEGPDARVAPIRRGLAVWGLTADDIGVLSIHGTSTGANENNETHLWQDILSNISRTPGNAVPCMAQKSLVGHSKGGSAAWQMAGLLQSVNSGIIPGNRNADNIDAKFQHYTNLMFPSKTIHTDGLRAGVMSSFGFGQVGGTALVVHPRYLFAALQPEDYASYQKRNTVRQLKSYKAMTEMMITNSLVKIKEGTPYSHDLERPVLLNSLARASLNKKTNTYEYSAKQPASIPRDLANVKAIGESLKVNASTAGVGVDQELISAVPTANPTFVARNFTDAEIAYCRSQPSPASSFAARWVGKEAVFKSLGVSSKGAAAAMKDIEILPNEAGAPAVALYGDAKAAAEAKGISKVHVSLSHSDAMGTYECTYAQRTALIIHDQKHSTLELIHIPHPTWPRPSISNYSPSHTSPSLRVAALDSSFNPPTLAHLALATVQPPELPLYDARLLLLSVRNADKKLKPGDATYEQRMAMMVLLAEDMRDADANANVAVAIIDEPTFVGKSTILLDFLRARLADNTNRSSPSPSFLKTELTFLQGLDTLERFLAPHYYGSPDQMRTALTRFFAPDGDNSHVVCARRTVVVDAAEEGEKERIVTDAAREFVDAGRVKMVDIGRDLQGLSSSEVRARVSRGEDGWRNMVSGRIADYVVGNRLYVELR
ncbi:thiolase-like protein [Amylostereum chailletii]|nr:thiolase-like protein [Amylostereum chailletii]